MFVWRLPVSMDVFRALSRPAATVRAGAGVDVVDMLSRLPPMVAVVVRGDEPSSTISG